MSSEQTGKESSGANRRLLVSGFVLSTLFTTALTLGGGFLVQTLQSQHVERKEQIDQFRTVSGQMDGLVTTFEEAYLRGKRTEDARMSLQKNIQDQYTALERVEPSLSADEVAVAKKYRRQIVTVSTRLDSLPPPGDSQALEQAIATARDTRIDVDSMLLKESQRWF